MSYKWVPEISRKHKSPRQSFIQNSYYPLPNRQSLPVLYSRYTGNLKNLINNRLRNFIMELKYKNKFLNNE